MIQDREVGGNVTEKQMDRQKIQTDRRAGRQTHRKTDTREKEGDRHKSDRRRQTQNRRRQTQDGRRQTQDRTGQTQDRHTPASGGTLRIVPTTRVPLSSGVTVATMVESTMSILLM